MRLSIGLKRRAQIKGHVKAWPIRSTKIDPNNGFLFLFFYAVLKIIKYAITLIYVLYLHASAVERLLKFGISYNQLSRFTTISALFSLFRLIRAHFCSF